jgi:pimeloyl-ACP methyl ester carboxylesterase
MTMTASVTPPDPHLDVVFVHGLGSDPKTWENKDTGFSWPEALQQSDSRLHVVNLAHYAPLFKFKDTSAVSAQFQATAKTFLDELKNHSVGTKRPIVFVTHSLGGIIVKEALRTAEHSREYRPILEKTRGIVFLATPHCGSGLANAAAYLTTGVRALGKLASASFKLKVLAPLGFMVWVVIELVAGMLRTSSLTSQLKKHDAPLMSLNDWFRDCARAHGIETHAFYETNLAYRCVHVVDPCSADPGVAGCVPRRAEFKDHMSISKPANSEDALFRTVATIIEDVRERSRTGKDYPVFRQEIAEALENTEFATYTGKGNFADIPRENNIRRKVEALLREKFRQRLEHHQVTPTQERDAGISNYDLDRFLLCLWLERHLWDQLNVLLRFVEAADGTVRAGLMDVEPPTLILLYRTVRTLDHILLDQNYGKLERVLNRARNEIHKRYAKERDDGRGPDGIDANGVTQRELEEMAKVAIGFEQAINSVRRTSSNAQPAEPER